MAKNTNEACRFCLPIKEIEPVLGVFTDTELVAVRDGIEALGKPFQCGTSRLTCVPLLQFQKEINRRETGKRGKTD